MKVDWTEHRIREEKGIIRQRLFFAGIQVAAVFLILVLVGGFVYSMEMRETQSAVTEQLQTWSIQIERAVVNRPRISSLRMDNLIAADSDMHYVVWNRAGTHLQRAFRPFSANSMQALQQQLTLRHPSSSSYLMSIAGVPYQVWQTRWTNGQWLQVMEDVRDDQSRLARLLSLLMWGGLFGLLLTSVGGFFLGLWTLRPIMHMRRREQELLSDVSHELRTPLTVLTTHAEMLIQHSPDRIEDHLSWIEAIYGETQRMNRLVRGLLELNHLETGKALQLETVSVQELLDTVANAYEPVLEEAGLALTVIPLDTPGVIQGDRMRLMQLLYIFLDNARKHTHDGGITLKVSERGAFVNIHVQDTGEGMSAQLLQRATERFVRGDTARQRGMSTGLGLAIAKGIVQAHRGRLMIHSRPGRGTEVVVSLRRH